MNNALTQAGYKEELLPRSQEIEKYTEEEHMEFIDESQRVVDEIKRRLSADPWMMGRVRVALGINVSHSLPFYHSSTVLTGKPDKNTQRVGLGLITSLHGSSTKR